LSTHALRIVRPPPAPPVPKGQRCLEFFSVVVVTHPPQKRAPKVCKAPHPLAHQQFPIKFPAPVPRARPRPRRSPALKEFVPRRGLQGARPRSMGTHRISRAERQELKVDLALLKRAGTYRRRPKTYGECRPGPCPWMSCRHHLKLDVDETTHAVKDNFPGLDFDQMTETCSLRVADTVPEDEVLPLEQVGAFANITMERARQLEKEGLASMKRAMKRVRRKGA
jgi:hypothetical protein